MKKGHRAGVAWANPDCGDDRVPLDDDDVPLAAATPDLSKWSDEGLTIPSPAGTAIGSTMQHLSSSGAKIYLVRFLATADSPLSVWPHGKDS